MILPVVYSGFLIINLSYYFFGKRSRLLSFITELFIILFVSGKRYYGGFIAYDLQHYETNYYNQTEIGEVGYSLLRDFGSFLNLSFTWFYVALTSACIFFIFHAVRKMKGNLHLFAVAYLVYFVLIPIDQLKNLCAFTVFISIVPFLFEPGFKGSGKYLIGIIIASCFHPSYILYALFLFCRIGNKKSFLKALAGVSALFCVLVALFRLGSKVSEFVLSKLIVFNSYSRYDKYFQSSSNYAPIVIVIIYLLCFWLIVYWNKHTSRTNCQKGSILVSMVAICGCFLPLLIMSMTTYRLVRDVTLVIIAYASTGLGETGKNKRFFVGSFVVAISLGLFVYDIVIKNYWNDYLVYFFQHEFFI